MLDLKKSFSVFLIIMSLIIAKFLNLFQHEFFMFETSVWCLRGSDQSNICKFKNICYDVQFKTFIFFLGNGTVIKGFDHYTELQKIQLSSVQAHNHFYANISVTENDKYNLSKELKIHSKILLFSRFKPNNLMHVIHDDLLPVYLTLESACLGDTKCIESYSLMFHDNYPEGPFFLLYKLFSKHQPILPSKLNSNPNSIFCFEQMLTGLILDGIFYQYGFKKPHGPIKPTGLTYFDISRFTSFIKNKMAFKFAKMENSLNSGTLLLLSRQKNRKILNISEVKQMIKSAYQKANKNIKVKLINLDLFTHDLFALIKLVTQCEGLIGMHGAEMILSLFMKPGSFVLEIFPFGINPNVVSFIKPISELEGSNFMYFSWKNLLKNNSVAHPDAHPLFGGIAHLDKSTQESIKNTSEVPAVECCNNPLFLYYMYQDTLISNEFREFCLKLLSKTFNKQRFKNNIKKWFYPYKVFNVTCIFNFHHRLLNLSWHPPFNAENTELKYSLYIRDQMGLFNKDISTEKINLQLQMPNDLNSIFEVWISAYCIENGSKGPDVYLKCH